MVKIIYRESGKDFVNLVKHRLDESIVAIVFAI